MPYRDVLLSLLVVIIWGGNFVVGRIGVSEVPPYFFTALRFLIVFIVIAPFIQWREISIRSALTLGLVMGVGHFGSIFAALASGINLPALIVMGQLTVPLSFIIGSVFLKEKVSSRSIAGLCCSGFGIMFLFEDQHIAFPLWGLIFTAIGVITFSVGNLLGKILPKLSPAASVGSTALVASPILFLLSLATEGSVHENFNKLNIVSICTLLYTALLSSIVAYTIWYRLLREYDISHLSSFLLFLPLVGISASVIALHEPMTNSVIIGGIGIIVGVFLINSRKPPIEEPMNI